MTTAHIAGLPVEETLAMAGPVIGLWASLTIYEIRRRLPQKPRATRNDTWRG